MKRIRVQFRAAEDGAAMLTALLAVVILSGLALVFMNRANTEARASGNSRDHEAAIHVAEAAADNLVAKVNADDDYVTNDAAGNVIELPEDLDDEVAWAMELRSEVLSSGVEADAWVVGSRGESFAVRPYGTRLVGDPPVATDGPLNVIYAVGAVPSFDAPNAKIRVVKLQIARDSYIPEFALLSAGPLSFGGNAAIVVPGCDSADPEGTCDADVHTNANFTNPGNASTIQGQVSQADGTCPGSVTALNGCIDGVEPKPIPAFVARDFYNRGDDLNPDPEYGQAGVGWFDLCPPGKPDGMATIREPGDDPCLPGSEVIWPSDENPGNSFRGWKWQAGEWRGSAIGAGVFYVYHADAKVTGTTGAMQRAVSILVEQDPAAPGGSGGLGISGNPKVQAALQSVLFIADTDVDLQGTLSADDCDPTAPDDEQAERMSGFIGAGEQLKVMGNVSVHGSIIVRDRADAHNLVKRNNDGVQGNMCLEYDDNLDVDFTGIWVITYWNEL